MKKTKLFSSYYRTMLTVISSTVLIVLLSGNSATSVTSPAQNRNIVLERQTTEGTVIGDENSATGTISWKAIPYAKPPVDELRWKAPQAPDKRPQPLKADTYCRICPQYIDHDNDPATPQIIDGNEDCLYLNIWAPKKTAGKMPVFFWIHGGGNSIQWPLLSMLDGGILASRGKMVVITVNYRLGPMGFFSHPALKTGDEAGDSGNFGILDLIAALKWVQANVKNFGGDPGNVTIAGESAGGQNVFCLITSPMAKGLFHRAISESAVLHPSTPREGAAHINAILAKLMVKDGTAADENAAAAMLESMPVKDIETYMRSKEPADFLDTYPEGKERGMIRFPVAFGDGKVLPVDFYGALASGDYNKVPMIMGSNKEEAKLFLRLDQPFKTWREDQSLFQDLTRVELFDLAAKYQSDGWKVMAVNHPARIMRNNNGQQSIFTYQFLWGAGGWKKSILSPPINILLGACHAMEIDFVYGTDKASLGGWAFKDKNKPGRVALSNAIMDYWTHFARTGNPNRKGSGLPQWSSWSNTEGSPKTLLLDADLKKAKITMSNIDLTQEEIEAALKKEPRHVEIQPFWDNATYRRH